ncbi:hypothetical protein JTB14_028324 [Gonioctena quinquepunctata]|nr:hypothetical protein JTB14_028324 [Gonioctena quinquepunctata]
MKPAITLQLGSYLVNVESAAFPGELGVELVASMSPRYGAPHFHPVIFRSRAPTVDFIRNWRLGVPAMLLVTTLGAAPSHYLGVGCSRSSSFRQCCRCWNA